jgi:glucokinase
MTGVLVGVDLGGTNIRAAVATGEATHEDVVRRDTPAHEGPDAVLDAVAACVRTAAGAGALDGVAIGIPGPLDPASGVVHAAPHLEGWHEVPAASILSDKLGCPVAVRNDATLAGFAEWKAGAGKHTRYFIFITVSTGIGGALVFDGRLYEGVGGSAGEIGHAPALLDGPPCGQGHNGCLEGAASGTAIAAAARHALASGTTSALSQIDAATLDARAVQGAAQHGDTLAIQLFADAGRALGRAIGGLINLLNPEVVAIGGGLINAGDLLFKPMDAAVPEIAFEFPASKCRIVPAALGTDAGMVGAVAWATHVFGQPSR